MAKKRSDDLMIGEDAFLDTIANLVGILIILVVIVSTGTRSAAELIQNEKLEAAKEELENPVASAQRIETDLRNQSEQLAKHELEIVYRAAERDAILEKLVVAKQAIEDRKSSVDDESRKQIENQFELKKLEEQLDDLVQLQEAEVAQEKSAIILQHLPTPMAKTVFGREVHIMVRNNRISVIPWDRLVERLKEDARNAVGRSIKRERIEQQLEPIEGFVMNYILVSKKGLVSNGSMSAIAQMVELEKFELDPTPDLLEQPIDISMSEHGRLKIELSTYSPRDTTITAWVYPDSFETFRQLKELLYVDGYMTAARPIPEGVKIGASPRGTQSSAQ